MFFAIFLPSIVLIEYKKTTSTVSETKYHGILHTLKDGFLITFKDLLPSPKNQLSLFTVWVVSLAAGSLKNILTKTLSWLFQRKISNF